MKVSVDLPDAEREVMGRLIAAGRSGVDLHFPTVPLAKGSTAIQVDLESSDTDDYPVVERAQVRVTCHAAKGERTVVKELAGDVLADLYSWGGNANVAGVVPISGRSAVSTDPDTGNVMCWVLVRVDLLATTAAS